MKKHLYTSNGMHYIVRSLIATRQGTSFVVDWQGSDRYMCLCDCGKRFVRSGRSIRSNSPTCGDHTLQWRKEHTALDITLTADQWMDLQQNPKPLDQWWKKNGKPLINED